MKTTFLIIALLFSSASFAQDLMGGVVDSSGRQLALSCVSQNNDGNCEEIDVLIKYNKGERFEAMTTLRAIDPADIAAFAKKRANRDLNETYSETALIGVGIGGAVLWVSGSAVVGIPAMVVGGAVDIVKAPVVGALYLTHKISDVFAKARLKKLVKFMMNPKKVGKTKKTRKRYMKGLSSAFRNY